MNIKEDKLKRTLIIFITMYIILFSPYLFSQERVTADYRIGPKDLLDISVFGLDELTKTVRVSEDGRISLPLVGEVEVEGITKAELEKKLSQLLEEKYLQNPGDSFYQRVSEQESVGSWCRQESRALLTPWTANIAANYISGRGYHQ